MKVKFKNGKVLDMYYQQYEIGLYICFYENGRLYDQFGLDISKEKFLEDLKSNKDIKILQEVSENE